MKISPFVEERPKNARGRPIEHSVCDNEHEWRYYSPQMKRDLIGTIYWDMRKMIVYLMAHYIPQEGICVRPITYHPNISEVPVIYVAIRDDKNALFRFRNHVNRTGLHCYEEVGDIPPLIEDLSDTLFKGIPDLSPRRPIFKGDNYARIPFHKGLPRI